MQPFNVSILVIIYYLTPGYDVGACACGVVTLEAVSAIRFDFTADEAVGVLLGVEIVESFLEGEEAVAVTGEHENKAAVPHENITVIGRIDIGAHKSRALRHLTDIPDGDFPRAPVHLQFLVVTRPNGIGQYLTGLFKRAGNDCLRFLGPEFVLGRKNFFDVSVLVRKLILHIVAARLCGCS